MIDDEDFSDDSDIMLSSLSMVASNGTGGMTGPSPKPKARRGRPAKTAAAARGPRLELSLLPPLADLHAMERQESEILCIRAMQMERLLTDTRFSLARELKRQPSNDEWGEAVGLTPQELVSQLLSGRRARAQLVDLNGGLVRSVIKKYIFATFESRSTSRADLEQEG